MAMCSCSIRIAGIDELFDGTFFEDEVSYKEPPKIEVSDYYTTPYDSPVERELSESEVEFYNLICYYLESYELSFSFENADENEVIKAYKAVVEDHPEYFWVNGGYRYVTTDFGSHKKIDFTPVSQDSVNDIAAKDAKFKVKVQSVVEEAEKLENLYDKVLYVHDYIVDNTSYDYDAAASTSDSDYDEYFDSRTSYGCLVNGKAVCSGYAEAFQCIMQALDIPCGCISGVSVDGGEPHEWNYVKLGDYNYQIDVTWDDPSYSDTNGEKAERKSYDYFLVTTEEMEITHKMYEDQLVPECNGLEYNYYIYNGLYFPEYDFEYVAYTIRENAASGSVSLKFGSQEECQAAYNDLISNNRIFRIDGVDSHISYIQGNSGLTMTFNFS